MACLARFGVTKTTAQPHFTASSQFIRRGVCSLAAEMPHRSVTVMGDSCGFFFSFAKAVFIQACCYCTKTIRCVCCVFFLNWDVRWKSRLSPRRTYLNWWIWAVCILWLCEYLCCAEMVPKLFFQPAVFLLMTLRNNLYVCEQVFFIEHSILELILSQNCNRGQTSLFFSPVLVIWTLEHVQLWTSSSVLFMHVRCVSRLMHNNIFYRLIIKRWEIYKIHILTFSLFLDSVLFLDSWFSTNVAVFVGSRNINVRLSVLRLWR